MASDEVVKKVEVEYFECMIRVALEMEALSDRIRKIVNDNWDDLSLEDFEKCMLVAIKTLDAADELRGVFE